MEFNYDIHVNISPPVLRRGKKVKVTAAITNPTKEIAYCVGEIVGYNMRQRLEPTINDTYTLTLGIPIIVPKGIYLVKVYAISVDKEKGPEFQAEIKIA